VTTTGASDRYGLGAVVPLLELLHSGSGLGYPAGYRNTCLPTPPPQIDAHARSRTALLTRLSHTAAWEQLREVELTDADLDALSSGIDLRPQPHTDLRVEVHAPTRAALDQGLFRLHVLGASRAAGTVTGRFHDLLGPDELGRVTAGLDGLPTVTDGAVQVQLSGPPTNRTAATITRAMPMLPCQLTIGGPTPLGSLQPGDHAVSADTAGLYLVITATGTPVEPTLLSALELVRCADPTLRFLCEITTSASTPCQPFAWEPMLRELPHLPRLRYRRTVVTPARWTVRPTDLTTGNIRDRWRTWRHRWSVPDQVLLGEHDRRLRLDLAEAAHLHLLDDTLTRRGHLTLFEAPAPDAFGWIDDHAHELVLPLATTIQSRHPARPRPTATVHAIADTGSPRTRHAPGASQWIEARLTSRPEHQDTVLTTHLPRLLTEITHLIGRGPNTDSALSWWFLRLVEPDHHLRLRLRLPAPRQFGDVVARLTRWANRLTDAGLLGDLNLGTYRPETGRFGHGPVLQVAEMVFAADSAAALAQLTLTTADPATDVGQALTAASILDLVTAFSPTAGAGRHWLIGKAPRTLPAPADRALRARAVELARPDHRTLADLPGGDRVLAAWGRRRTALSAYRAALLDAGTEPEIVLADLLHLHHTRVAGPHLDRERICLNLARAAALSQNARTTPAGHVA
jgi:thiopeptide-type bacteriocin biosynthesis protein